MKWKIMVFLLALVLFLSGCFQQADNSVTNDGANNEQSNEQSNEQIDGSPNDGNEQENDDQSEVTEESEQVEEEPLTIEEQTAEVLEALKNQNMQQLSEMVDPNQGLLFSPYGYIDAATDLVFTANEVQNLLSDTTVYTWGSYDGKGDPIELTFNDYYDRFVYDQDYENADEVSYNDRLGQGNTIDNIADVYPNATTVEYHFEGFNPEYVGMDWRSLRLVFEQTNDTWYLVAVVHDEWTI